MNPIGGGADGHTTGCHRYSHSGTDLGRLNVARHGLATCICDVLHSLGVKYSMPSFSGPRAPGHADTAFTEMGRPLTGSQVGTLHEVCPPSTVPEGGQEQTGLLGGGAGASSSKKKLKSEKRERVLSWKEAS